MLLDVRDGGLMVHAVALANWHQAHGHCSRCGAVTEVTFAGHVRRCPVDGSEHFPRTDPAVIVLVTDEDDRCLLARNVLSPPGRFATVAGFVEPGESPEQAVVREVAEETGIVVTSSRYAGSQPWPFPSNLMLGFYARADGAEPRPDGEEIDEALWFSRDELTAALESGELLLSPSASISRRLIEGWYGSELHPRPVPAGVHPRPRPAAGVGGAGAPGQPGRAAPGCCPASRPRRLSTSTRCCARCSGTPSRAPASGTPRSSGKQVLRRGLSPLATTISTEHGAPVVAGIRLRAGKAGSGQGRGVDGARGDQHRPRRRRCRGDPGPRRLGLRQQRGRRRLRARPGRGSRWC